MAELERDARDLVDRLTESGFQDEAAARRLERLCREIRADKTIKKGDAILRNIGARMLKSMATDKIKVLSHLPAMPFLDQLPFVRAVLDALIKEGLSSVRNRILIFCAEPQKFKTGVIMLIMAMGLADERLTLAIMGVNFKMALDGLYDKVCPGWRHVGNGVEPRFFG